MKIQVGTINLKNIIRKRQLGKYKSTIQTEQIQTRKYNSEKYSSGNINREIQIGKIKSGKSENTDRKIQIGK